MDGVGGRCFVGCEGKSLSGGEVGFIGVEVYYFCGYIVKLVVVCLEIVEVMC